MRRLVFVSVPLAGVVAGAVASLLPLAAAEDHPAPVLEAARDWNRRCRSCHTVPDPAFETDRAFLRQISETS